MKSYIKHSKIHSGHYYECTLCGFTWTDKSHGKPWNTPAKLKGDGVAPTYKEQEFPRAGGGSITALVQASEPSGNYGVDECPSCGGSQPAKIVK